MPTVFVSLTPVDRSRRRIEVPLITAEDSPSRNPCKVRSEGPQGRAFRNEPYGFRAVSQSVPQQAGSSAAAQPRRVPMMPALIPPPTEVSYPPQPPRPSRFPPLEVPEPVSQPATTPAAEVASSPPRGAEQQTASDSSPPSRRPPPSVDSTPPRGGPSEDAIGASISEESPVWSGPRPARFVADQERATSLPPVERRGGSGKRPTAVIVKFKHQDGVFLLPSEADYPDPFLEGDYVVVEGDRGEHVGRIEQLHIQHHHQINGTVGTVIRKAYADEIDAVHRIRLQEPHISRQVQRLADEMDVAMRIVDTEVQTDRNKITIYFVSKIGTPVDFRQLQRRLFREFRCRIWFVDWETV